MEVTECTQESNRESSGEFVAINSSILAGLKHGSAACLLASAPLNSTIFRHHWYGQSQFYTSRVHLLLQCLHSLSTRSLNGLPVKHIHHWLQLHTAQSSRLPLSAWLVTRGCVCARNRPGGEGLPARLHTAKMVVVETLWQLHTLTLINSCSYYCNQCMVALATHTVARSEDSGTPCWVWLTSI